MSVSGKMARYRCHKEVWALKIANVKIDDVENTATITFQEPTYAPVKVDPAMFARYMPVPGDYFVVYDDGYQSISPAKAFEEGYSRVEPSALELGAAVRQQGLAGA